MAKKRKAAPAPPAASPAAVPGRDPLWPLVVLLAFSTALGVVAVWQWRQSPFNTTLVLDELSYFRWGSAIADGDVLGDKVFYQDPLYPYFLGLLLAVFGPHIAAIRLAQVLLGTAAVGLTYLAGRRLGGGRAGLVAGGILALCGSIYFFELLVLKASLIVVLCAATVYCGVTAATGPDRRWSFFGAGLTLGLLCLLRGNFLGIVPFAVAWGYLVVPGTTRSRAARAALVFVGAALAIAPVTVRNYVVGGELVLTTSQAGANFYIGNFPEATGAYGVIDFARPDPAHEADDFRAEAERRTGRTMTASEVSHFWFCEGLRWIAGHPGAAARLTLHKARLLIHQFEVPDNYSFALTRGHFVPALWLPFLGIGWLWGPALAAGWVLRRDRRLWYPAGFGLLYAASIIPFFIVDRYRTPLLAPAAVLAAVLVVEALRRVKAREFAGLTAAAVITVAGLGLGLWPTAESRFVTDIAAFNVGNAYFDAGDYAEAIRWYEMTLRATPGDEAALKNIRLSRQRLEAQGGR